MTSNQCKGSSISFTDNALHLAGLDANDARTMQNAFVRLLKAHNLQQEKHVSPLVFLDSKRDTLDPTLALFKIVHFLDTDLQAIRRSNKRYFELCQRVKKLVGLARYYVQRSNHLDVFELGKYLEGVERKMTEFEVQCGTAMTGSK